MPAVRGRSLVCAGRALGVYALLTPLLILALVGVPGCEATTTSLTVSSTAVALATRSSTYTATAAPADAFRDEIAAMTGLRGQIPASHPDFEIEQLANLTIVHVVLQLTSPTLLDVQSDAFLVQRALWLGQEFAIPNGWAVSVEFFVPSTNPPTQTLGREVGVANLDTASARQFAWASLSPQQAWPRYDDVAFNQNGL